MAEPIQLPLFPDQAALTRIRPERNEGRFYRLAVWPDLFGVTGRFVQNRTLSREVNENRKFRG
jgi:hypothetical protein